MVPQAVRDPAPEVVLVGLGDSAVTWSARVWAAQKDNSLGKQALIRAVKMELDQAGIGIPFPQMDVHFFRASQQKAA
jgi:small conductance mechanosensitive channel